MGIQSNIANETGGISFKRIMIPIICVLVILHVGVFTMIVSINRLSASLSENMKRTSEYIDDATGLLAGSSILSETSTNYILMPKSDNGQSDVSPLAAYSSELGNDRRGPDVVKRFEKYNVSKAAKTQIKDAAKCAQSMLDSQIHALSLMDSVYPIPDIPALSNIKLIKLTQKEKAMSRDAKVAAARSMMLSTEYALNKQTVSKSVNACTDNIREDASAFAAETSKSISISRTAIWILSFLITAILILTFVILFKQVFAPLVRFTKLISSEDELEVTSGFKEIRMLASAYNIVKRKRDALDGILRSAASTDPLTNLHNRYGFEQYLLDVQDGGYAMTLILFDVNYLKQVNDTQGHAAGDRLLKSAAGCITKCFGNDNHDNCFRFGGDEFAAVLKDVSRKEVDSMISTFEKEQKQNDVSIAWGYSYSDDISNSNIRAMIDEADRRMYDQKKRMHVIMDKSE